MTDNSRGGWHNHFFTACWHNKPMSILERHNIKRTHENIATAEMIVRGVPRQGMPVSVNTREAAELLMKALDCDGWDGFQVFDLLPFKVQAETVSELYVSQTAPHPLPR